MIPATKLLGHLLYRGESAILHPKSRTKCRAWHEACHGIPDASNAVTGVRTSDDGTLAILCFQSRAGPGQCKAPDACVPTCKIDEVEAGEAGVGEAASALAVALQGAAEHAVRPAGLPVHLGLPGLAVLDATPHERHSLIHCTSTA